MSLISLSLKADAFMYCFNSTIINAGDQPCTYTPPNKTK